MHSQHQRISVETAFVRRMPSVQERPQARKLLRRDKSSNSSLLLQPLSLALRLYTHHEQKVELVSHQNPKIHSSSYAAVGLVLMMSDVGVISHVTMV